MRSVARLRFFRLLSVLAMLTLCANHRYFASAANLRVAGEVLGLQPNLFDEWAAESGHTVTYTQSSVEDQTADLTSGLGFFDVYQTGSWVLSEWVEKNFVSDLTPLVKSDASIGWTDILVQARENLASYNGRVYALPVDLDPIILYYRRDLSGLTRPPLTWPELIEQAKLYHNTDLNGDGVPDAGICLMPSHFVATAISTTLYKYEAGTRNGPFFDTNPDDQTPMTSMLHTEGYVKTLEYIQELYKYSHHQLPDIQNVSYSQRNSNFGYLAPFFAAGRCAFFIGFTSTGTWFANPTRVWGRGKLGVARVPGSEIVYSRKTKSMVQCDPSLCTMMEGGNINRPVIIMGGGIMVVGRKSAQQAAATSFVSFVSRKLDVRKTGGLNPYRRRQLNATWFAEPGEWELGDAQMYTGALIEALEQEHAYPIPRIPIMSEIQRALEAAVAEAIRLPSQGYENSTRSNAEIVQSMDQSWQQGMIAKGFSLEGTEITLRRSLSLPERKDPPALSGSAIALIVVLCLVVVGLLAVGGMLGQKAMARSAAVRFAPKDAAKPVTTLFVSLKNHTLLWERYTPEEMGRATDSYRKVITSAAEKHRCYVGRTIGSAIMITAAESKDAIACAAAIQSDLRRVNWSEYLNNDAAQVRAADKASRRSGQSHRSKRSTRRDDRASESGSRRSSHSSHRDALTISFGMGLAQGVVRITHNEEANSYDYAGKAVEQAAVVSDIAQGGQMLLHDSVTLSDSHEADCAVFTTMDVLGKSGPLLQYNDPAMPPKTFIVPGADDVQTTNVDSVASALSQQTGAFAPRRVTILSAFLHGWEAKTSKCSREAMLESTNSFFEALNAEIEDNKGHLEHFNCGRLVISFNAARPTPAQLKRAFNVADFLRRETQGAVTCGLAQGNAMVGPSGGQTVVVADLVDSALVLETLCRNYDNVTVLTNAALRDDCATFVNYQWVDVACISKDDPSKVSGLISLDDVLGSTEDDEWMYELEKAQGTPQQVINRAFEALLQRGNVEEAAAVLEKVAAGDNKATDAQASDIARMVSRLKAVLDEGGPTARGAAVRDRFVSLMLKRCDRKTVE